MKATARTVRLFAAAVFAFFALNTIGCHAEAPKTETSKPKDLTKMNDSELRKTLTPEQYNVCKQNGTEPPFRNAYWDNHEAGLYVDVISGEPLFASTHKFDSGTGWPSFWKPVKEEALLSKGDNTHGMDRTEVRSAKSDSHLGHVFTDGPKPTGLRYCINSASLRFIPVNKLKEFGYEQYLHLFETAAK